jgi:hypothetical protein
VPTTKEATVVGTGTEIVEAVSATAPMVNARMGNVHMESDRTEVAGTAMAVDGQIEVRLCLFD